jgi:eukaryotic-like serine/threonine-protein kinase
MQPGKLLRDRYRIEKALAVGGFGQTFLAVDNDSPSKQQVVVKLLKPSSNDPATLKIAQRLFKQEAEILERLGKDNDRIPSLYAYLELGGEFYLVQEYIVGSTLREELQGRKISEADTLDILKEILIGLTKVHSQNIIHRDLKPDNIIRRKSDRKLVLIDFGAVKQVRLATVMTPNPSVCRTISIGTEGYMPSEQNIGYPKPASDIYAVGAIAIQCLTGSEPHLLFDENSLKLEWQHQRQVKADLAQVLNKMVAPDYRQRYANAAEALQAIESLIDPTVRQQVKATPQTPPTVLLPTVAIGRRTLSLSSIPFTSVKLDRSGNIIARPTDEAEAFIEDLDNGVELTMVKIPAGKFMMGSPESEQRRNNNESPQHQVNIPEFYLAQTLVTQAQWVAIMSNNPSWWQKIVGYTQENPNPSCFQGNDRLPVERVSWLAAMDFCQKLSQITPRTYRLPTEAEWEYACRAGMNTPFAFGETITSAVVNYDGNYPYGGAAKGEYRQKTTPVGSFPPNLFGLYDMHGNVWEWCLDEWIDNYNLVSSDGSARGNISSRDENKQRVLRGGSLHALAQHCRSAHRLYGAASLRGNLVGFRVVCQQSSTPIRQSC